MDVSKLLAPDFDQIVPEDGLTLVQMPFSGSGGASFVDGDDQGNRLRLRMFVRESDCRLFTKAWFGPRAEGPPGYVHGGGIAAVLDHTMGVAAWVAGYPVLAASITINFLKKLPLGEIVTVETWVSGCEGKKVTTQGRIYDADLDTPYSTGEGIFILQRLDALTKLAGHWDVLQSRMKDRPVEPAE